MWKPPFVYLGFPQLSQSVQVTSHALAVGLWMPYNGLLLHLRHSLPHSLLSAEHVMDSWYPNWLRTAGYMYACMNELYCTFFGILTTAQQPIPEPTTSTPSPPAYPHTHKHLHYGSTESVFRELLPQELLVCVSGGCKLGVKTTFK